MSVWFAVENLVLDSSFIYTHAVSSTPLQSVLGAILFWAFLQVRWIIECSNLYHTALRTMTIRLPGRIKKPATYTVKILVDR